MIVDTRHTTYEHNILIGLKDKETLKKTLKKKSAKKVVEEVAINESESFRSLIRFLC